MLAAVKLGRCDTRLGEFLVPLINAESGDTFVGIDSGKVAEFGAVSYTGKDLVAQTLFARYVDSGAKIPDVDGTLDCFDEYLRQIKTFKVGNVLGIRYADAKFDLYLAHNRPPSGAM